MLFKCKTCEVLDKQITYLKTMINALHEKLNIPVLEESQMVEDFKDEPQSTMNKDGYEPPEIHDD